MSLPIHHMISSGPQPVAPFSHAVEADGFVFITGQMPTDPAAPEAPLPEGIEAQTRRVIDNLKLILGGVGLGLEHVTMARIFFEAGKLPARTTVGVTALAVGALVEIDLIARRP